MKIKKKATIRKKDGLFRIRRIVHPRECKLEDLNDETVYIVQRYLKDTGIKPFAAHGYELKGSKYSKWPLYSMVPQVGELRELTLQNLRWSDKTAILVRLPSGFETAMYPRPKNEKASARSLNVKMRWYD